MIEHAGGAVLVRAAVQQIVLERGRAVGVEMGVKDRAIIRVRKGGSIISSAGVRTTLCKLLDEEGKSRMHRELTALERLPPGCGHFMLFVSLKGSKVELGLPAANLWIGPTFDHDTNVGRWYKSDDGPPISTEHFPAVFVSFPSAKDPEWASETHSTCHVIAECRYSWVEAFEGERIKHRGGTYNAMKEQVAVALLEVLFGQFPDLQDKIDFYALGTPLSTNHYFGVTRGESYGLACTCERYQQEWLQPTTTIPGLILTGQDTLSPGVCGALIAGFISAAVVRPRLLWPTLRIAVNL